MDKSNKNTPNPRKGQLPPHACHPNASMLLPRPPFIAMPDSQAHLSS